MRYRIEVFRVDEVAPGGDAPVWSGTVARDGVTREEVEQEALETAAETFGPGQYEAYVFPLTADTDRQEIA